MSDSPTTEGGQAHPFARPLERHCAAVADALLKACEYEQCALEDFTEAQYDDLRRRMPHLGLPRTTTITGACGGWDEAVGHALVKRAMDTRPKAA